MTAKNGECRKDVYQTQHAFTCNDAKLQDRNGFTVMYNSDWS